MSRFLDLPPLALCALLALGQSQPNAVPGEPPTPSQVVDASQVEALRAELAAATGLDPVVQQQAATLLDQAAASLAAAAQLTAAAEEMERLAQGAPERLAAIQRELANPPADSSVEVPEGATLESISQLRRRAEADLAAARQATDALETEATRRQEARKRIADELPQKRALLGEIEDSLKEAQATLTTSLLDRCRLVQLQAKAAELREAIRAATSELASYDARTALLPARIELAQRRVMEAQQKVSAWQEIESQRRRFEAERTSAEARAKARAAALGHPALKAFAEENEQLAARRAGADGTAAQLTHAQRELTDLSSSLEATRDRFDALRRMLAVAGLNPAMALLLQRQYEGLEDLRRLRRESAIRQRRMSEAQYQALLLQERLKQLTQEQASLYALLPEDAQSSGEAEVGVIRETIQKLISDRRTYISELVSEYQQLAAVLTEAEATSRELIALVSAYRAFIEENILWVRSVPSSELFEAGAAYEALQWLMDPREWQSVTQEGWRGLLADWVSASLLLSIAILLALRRTVLRRIGQLRERAGRYATDNFGLTAKTLLLSILLGLPLPFAFWLIASVLSSGSDIQGVPFAIGVGARSAALLLLPLSVFCPMLIQGGLCDVHLRWPTAGVVSLRRQLQALLLVLYPSVTLVGALSAQPVIARNNSLGRLVFMIAMLALAVVLLRVSRRNNPLLEPWLRRNSDTWIARLRPIWGSILVLSPPILGVLAAAGYYYTALQLSLRLANTLGLALGLILVDGLLLRWLFLARRRLAVEAARKRREEARKAAAGEVEGEQAGVAPEAEIDVPAISAQSRQLFRSGLGLALFSGLYLIWAGVLPALRVLDRVEIWPSFRVRPHVDALAQPGLPGEPLSRAVPSGAGTESGASPTGSHGEEGVAPGVGNPAFLLRTDQAGGSQPPPGPDAVTLVDLGTALILLLLTIVASRNLPGLLEITVFQRIGTGAATRYAIGTLGRYVILIVGVSASLAAIGIAWERVQWLAAALTFGLAFGLQEIFANFVSGIIMLTEQPLRVGDFVTVGSTEGRVTRIRMRATTITDVNRKELIVPNKEFITSQFINWSLSDPITRLVIPVGVAYGSDTRLARRLLLEAAASCSTILKDPQPDVVFRAFGASSLDFELRCYIGTMDDWPRAMTEIHTRIDEVFRKHGVEIAFPQLDVHLRSVDATLPVRREGGEGE